MRTYTEDVDKIFQHITQAKYATYTKVTFVYSIGKCSIGKWSPVYHVRAGVEKRVESVLVIPAGLSRMDPNWMMEVQNQASL